MATNALVRLTIYSYIKKFKIKKMKLFVLLTMASEPPSGPASELPSKPPLIHTKKKALIAFVCALVVYRRRRRQQRRKWKWKPVYEYRQHSFSLDLMPPGRAKI